MERPIFKRCFQRECREYVRQLFSNLAHGKVSGLSIVGLIAGAFLVFGRTGWLGKIAGIFLTMMMIGNNTQRQQEASVTDNQRQARPQQEQEEQTHSGGMRR